LEHAVRPFVVCSTQPLEYTVFYFIKSVGMPVALMRSRNGGRLFSLPGETEVHPSGLNHQFGDEMLFVLCIVALIVGILIGTVGVGGILLIPAMAALAQITTHASMATSLFSFIFTGIIGTWIYQRHGSINWKITMPVCGGSVIFGYLGAIVNAYANATVLNIILACIIIFAGIYA
jgi:hypothetical protein